MGKNETWINLLIIRHLRKYGFLSVLIGKTRLTYW